jgi:hypothetical protein
MKGTNVIGIILIVLGTLALAYQRITYTKEKELVDVGPIGAITYTKKTFPLPPVIGGAAIAGGVALLLIESRSRSGM